MKKIVDDRRVIIKVCDMYYNQELTQAYIAKVLNLSRPTISRMLVTAKEKGIVKILISDISETKYFDLERKLESLYGLKEVIIVDTKADMKIQKKEAGKATARYLSGILKEGDVVGVSMGTTLKNISPYVECEKKGCMFIPLIGGVGQVAMDLHSNYIAEDLARAYRGHFMLMHASAVVSNSRIKEELMKEEQIKQVMAMAEHMDIALLGVGAAREGSTAMATGYYGKNDIDSMKARGVVGDICMRFFDINGNTDIVAENENVFGIDLKKYRRVPYSIGISVGSGNAKAIIGAINGRYINALITDEECGLELCEEQKLLFK